MSDSSNVRLCMVAGIKFNMHSILTHPLFGFLQEHQPEEARKCAIRKVYMESI